MFLKESVKINGIRPEIIIAIIIANSVFDSFEVESVITSITDGKHSAVNSLHYSGAAVDFRIKNIPDAYDVGSVALLIRERLTKDYQVILESTHIHIEYQLSF